MFKEGNLLYPVIGIGAFFVMFLFGAVTAYDFGLSGVLILVTGTIAGCAGAALVADLERRDPGA